MEIKIEKFINKNIEKEIFKYWYETYFKCEKGVQASGTTVISDEELVDSNLVNIYYINKGSLVKLDPVLYDDVTKFVNDKCNSKAINSDDIRSFFGSKNVDEDCTVCLWYLQPEKFNEVKPETEFSIRQLLEEDKKYLDELKGRCSEEELDEGCVDIDDAAVFGCFYGDKLVAVSSIIYWGDIIADIGVITHPEFRGKGLGKAVVTALCRCGFENNRIMQYRCELANQGSYKIAKALGFTMNIFEEDLEIKK